MAISAESLTIKDWEMAVEKAIRNGVQWQYLAGDLPAWTKSAEWTGGYPISTSEIALYGGSMKFEGSRLTADTGMISRTGLSPALNWSGGRRIGIVVYAHRLNATTGIRLRVGLNASNYKYYDWKDEQNTLVEGWNFLVVHTQEDGALRLLQTGSSGPGWVVGAGSYDFDTQPATYLALEAVGMRAPNYPTLWIGSLFSDGAESLPMITIGFDISYNFQSAKQVLDAYGFKGYLAVGSVTQAGQDDLVNIYNDGWDIVGHSALHQNLGTYTDKEAIATELNRIRTQLRALGMHRSADLFASPNGGWSNRSVNVLAAEGYTWHRAVTNAPIAQYDCSIGHLNPLTQGAFSCGAATSAQLNSRAYLLLVKYKANCHFYSHEAELGGDGTNWPTDANNIYTYTLDGLCAYLKGLQDAGLCRVVTPSEYLAISGGGRANQFEFFRTPNMVSIPLAASPAIVANVTNAPVIYVVSAGTVSLIDITIDGTNYLTTGQTGGMFTVESGASIRITYTIAPTVTQVRGK